MFRVKCRAEHYGSFFATQSWINLHLSCLSLAVISHVFSQVELKPLLQFYQPCATGGIQPLDRRIEGRKSRIVPCGWRLSETFLGNQLVNGLRTRRCHVTCM